MFTISYCSWIVDHCRLESRFLFWKESKGRPLSPSRKSSRHQPSYWGSASADSYGGQSVTCILQIFSAHTMTSELTLVLSFTNERKYFQGLPLVVSSV